MTRLEYHAVRVDRYGRHLAAPIVVGTDGTDYNISIVMVYAGLAKAAYYGDNAKYLDHLPLTPARFGSVRQRLNLREVERAAQNNPVLMPAAQPMTGLDYARESTANGSS